MLKWGASATLRARIVRVYVWVLRGICSIRRREGVRQRDNCLLIRMTERVTIDVVCSCVQTFYWGSPPSEKFLYHHHHIAAQALRSRTHVSAFALVVY